MNEEIHEDQIHEGYSRAGPKKVGSSYEVDLNDSLSSIESVGSWMAQSQNSFIGEIAPQTPPHSPSPSTPSRRPAIRNHNGVYLSPLHTPKKSRIRALPPEATSTPAVCSSPCVAGSLGKSPGKPPRPPLLKKRSRRGILRSTRTSSRRSLLSSSQSSDSLTPNSRTPSSSVRRRNRSVRNRKKNSPFKVEKRVSFCLPDDSSEGTSVGESLLFCDVETMETSLHMDHWGGGGGGGGGGDDFGNQSCRIVLPFMDGLDDSSDDEFALDEGEDDGGRLPTTMEDWFNSAGDLGCNFESLDDEESFSEGYPTPCRGEASDEEESSGTNEECKSAEPSSSYAKKGMVKMLSPLAGGMPVLSLLDDLQKTPIVSNAKDVLQDLEEEEGGGVLPTLTPIPKKEVKLDQENGTKESPTSVLDLAEPPCASKVGPHDPVISDDDDDSSIALHECTEHFASVQLGTDDIAVRDVGQRAVTEPFRNQDVNSSTAVPIISSDPVTVPTSECRLVANSLQLVETPQTNQHEMSEHSKTSMVLSSPLRRSSADRTIATSSPLTQRMSMSPIGHMRLCHPGRGL